MSLRTLTFFSNVRPILHLLYKPNLVMMTVYKLAYHIFRILVLMFMNVISMELSFLLYSLFCFDSRVILSLNYDVEIILCFFFLFSRRTYVKLTLFAH